MSRLCSKFTSCETPQTQSSLVFYSNGLLLIPTGTGLAGNLCGRSKTYYQYRTAHHRPPAKRWIQRAWTTFVHRPVRAPFVSLPVAHDPIVVTGARGSWCFFRASSLSVARSRFLCSSTKTTTVWYWILYVLMFSGHIKYYIITLRALCCTYTYHKIQTR